MTAWQIVLIVIAGLIVLYIAGTMLAVGGTFASLYGRTDHTYSRRALFSDFPEIPIKRDAIALKRRKKLAVYILGEESEKGTVVISHGIRDYGEGYFCEARAFVSLGYRVLLYDATGSGNSTGRTQRGLPQSAIDLNNVLNWAEKQESLKGDFYLYGHSWGGYGVCAVFALGLHERVKAAASLSGFNDPCKMLLESGSTLSKHIGRFVYPALRAVQFLRFGTGMYRTAEEGIKKARNTRFLILQAENDVTVKKDGAAIYALKDKLQNDRVQFSLIEGRGHLNAWYSQECCRKNEAYDKEFYRLVGKYGYKLSKKQEKAFYAPIDREERIALSQPDTAFFSKIDEFYKENGDVLS